MPRINKTHCCGWFSLSKFPEYPDGLKEIRNWWETYKTSNHYKSRNVKALTWNNVGSRIYAETGKLYTMILAEYQWSKEIHDYLISEGWTLARKWDNRHSGTICRLYIFTRPEATMEPET